MSIHKILKKKHKDWTKEQIDKEAERIWKKYQEDNKEKLEKDAIANRKAFEESVGREFDNLLLDE